MTDGVAHRILVAGEVIGGIAINTNESMITAIFRSDNPFYFYFTSNNIISNANLWLRQMWLRQQAISDGLRHRR